ncbi:MAG: aromatic ring-hydroxylating oxygenase subunit alpha [Candidatus Polarisedimenticolia bacterium]
MPDRPSTSATRLQPALPATYYTDPSILAREWERIFKRSWQYVGREDRLPEPGDHLTLEVGDESVLMVRDRDRRLRAFYNVCRHRGSRLCGVEAGRGASSFQCSYHAWTYGLDGRLAGAPGLKGVEGFRKEDFGLVPVPLEVWRGFVFIRLQAEGEPLAAQLGSMPGRVTRYPLEGLKVERRTVQEVGANWKILFENYHECYHCPGVHPELCDLVPLYGTGDVDVNGGGVAALFRDGVTALTRSGATRLPALSGLNEVERRQFNGEAIRPNMWINFMPHWIQTRVLWPAGPGRTRIVTEWLYEAATLARPDFDPSEVMDFTMLISEQDWRVCESVQKGIGSRSFTRGVYMPQEEPLVEFNRWVLERLES